MKVMNPKLAGIGAAVIVLLFTAINAQPANDQNIEGTVWAVADSDKVSYVIEFRQGGKLNYNSSNSISGKGGWKQKGDEVYFTVNGGFAKFSGKIKSNHLEGSVINRRGRKWQWSGAKEEAVVVTHDAPRYPPIAGAARATGNVIVEVNIDPSGAVKSAAVIEGHPLLRMVSESSAMKWQFNHADNNINRTARLIFAFHILPTDCVGDVIYLPPVYPASYLVEVRRREMCPRY
jgi:TonB family protein